MEDDVSDIHMCIKCQKIFSSLDSYVQHRKTSCAKALPTTIPSYSVVSESELRPDDFFHSLQLQSCNTKTSESSKVIVKIEEVVLDCDEDSDEDVEEASDVVQWKSAASSVASPVDCHPMDDHDYVLKLVPTEKFKVVVGPKSRREAFVKRLVNDPQLYCTPCKIFFKSREDLVSHLTSVKDTAKENGEDDGEHNEMLLQYSHLLATTAPFKCDVCQFYFNTHQDLVEHWNSEVEAHLNCENQGFKCSACQVSFKTLQEMRTHLDNSDHLKRTLEVQDKGQNVIISFDDFIYCPKCNWIGKRQQALNFHMKWKHRSGNDNEKKVVESHKCSKCPFVSRKKASLLAHKKRSHRSENDEDNDLENEVSADEADGDWISDDYKAEGEKPKRRYTKIQSCLYCGDVCNSTAQLQEHIKESHPDKLFHCDVCSMYFEFESMFVKHKASRLHRYHVDNLAEINISTGDQTGKDNSCDQCSFKCFSKAGLLFHQMMHHGPSCSVDDKELTDENKRGKLYRCPICSQIFKLHILRSHLASHTGERPFPCQWCKESFMAKVTLASHIRTKHREKKFVCPYCPYKTQRRTKLVSHLDIHQLKEARVRKCLCDICGAGFFNRSSLKHHMRLHLPLELGGKTQICSFPGCRLSFRSPSELVYHMRTHTGERPFLCGNCGYSAKTKHQLTKHERSHNGQRPFKCRHCSYAAALSSQLLRHMRIHTGAKPYSCPYCDYTCNTHENLRKHVLKSKKHVGLSVYKCPHCDYGCNLASELKNHMFTNHSDCTEQSNPSDNAFSSVVSGIFSRDEDRRDVDHPSFPYVPRTEKPGYREKMRQSWKPRTADDNRNLSTAESESQAKSNEINRFIEEAETGGGTRMIIRDGEEELKQFQENLTVVVRDGDNDVEATAALKRLLETSAIVVPVNNDDVNASSSMAVLNGATANPTLMEASEENGSTLFFCVPVSP